MSMLPCVLVYVFFAITEIFSSKPQMFLRQPPDQTAIQGEHVTLPCRVVNKRGILQWTRDDFGLGTERNLTGFERYHMSGSDEEGDYTLDINPVLLEDDALFQCQVGAAEGVLPIRSRYATLTVTVPPEPPYIINGKEVIATEDQKIKIICFSRGGKPPADITWLDSSGQVLSTGVETERTPVANTKRSSTRSTITISASRALHNTSILCQAQNSADRQPKSVGIKIMVEYSPHITLTSHAVGGSFSGEQSVFEGHDIVFICLAQANPNNVEFSWFVDNFIVVGNHDNKLKLTKVSRIDNGKLIKCQVHNKVGKSQQTKIVNVLYSPTFIQKPEDISGEPGEKVVLKCLVDSNPPASYTWFRSDNIQTVIGYSSNLSLSISDMTTGIYICRASVTGFNEIRSKAEVFQRGPPRLMTDVENDNHLKYASLGQRVELICRAFSVPPPNIMGWNKVNEVGLAPLKNSKIYSLRENVLKNGMISTLVIKHMSQSDFGQYNCSVFNQYGSDSLVITLIQNSDLSLMLISSSVFVASVLTIGGLLIIAIFHRKRSLKTSGVDGFKYGLPEGSVNQQTENIDRNTYNTKRRKRYNKQGFDFGSSELRIDNDILVRSFDELSQNETNNTSNHEMVVQMDSTDTTWLPGLHSSGPGYHSSTLRKLNVVDPRLAAQYGNPYLSSRTLAERDSTPSPIGARRKSNFQNSLMILAPEETNETNIAAVNV